MLDTLSSFSTHSLWLYLLSHCLILISRLPFGCYSYAMRRDSEVPLEVGDGISMQGCRNVSQIVLERRKENNEHDMLVLEYVLSLSFRFGHSSVIHYYFLALPPRYHHQCRFTLVRKHWFSLCSIVLASLVHSPFQHLTIFTIFHHSTWRITWMSIAAPIGLYVIPGFGWVVKLLES